ncbi:hypothetical protein FOZ76_13325 [Verticiella sediminum]|uniref:Uncharacterized protein n=1 Tax=Verticiella sediminum TaxID=1247510 RepID=A0A556ALX2_9BURK|nr:hypothetical protein FOZ76_13325 [Verticiella sediminum]
MFHHAHAVAGAERGGGAVAGLDDEGARGIGRHAGQDLAAPQHDAPLGVRVLHVDGGARIEHELAAVREVDAAPFGVRRAQFRAQGCEIGAMRGQDARADRGEHERGGAPHGAPAGGPIGERFECVARRRARGPGELVHAAP